MKIATNLKVFPQCEELVNLTLTLFQDEKFPADNRLLTDNAGGDVQIISYFGRRQVRPSEIRWMRPNVSQYLRYFTVINNNLLHHSGLVKSFDLAS